MLDGRIQLNGKIGERRLTFAVELNPTDSSLDDSLPVHRLAAKAQIKKLQDGEKGLTGCDDDALDNLFSAVLQRKHLKDTVQTFYDSGKDWTNRCVFNCLLNDSINQSINQNPIYIAPLTPPAVQWRLI